MKRSETTTLLTSILVFVLLFILIFVFFSQIKFSQNSRLPSSSDENRSTSISQFKIPHRSITTHLPTTFNIQVLAKTPNNTFYHQGSPLCYYLNGMQQPELHLKRNVRYTFVHNDSQNSQHPFYFTIDHIGDNNAIKRIPESPLPLKSGSITVTFDREYPDEFYYQCSLHPQMGNLIVLTD